VSRSLGADVKQVLVMNMKKYHSDTLLYLHETIELGSGRSEQFTEVFSDVYQPMMEELGYIRELERLYVPWSERTGKRWLGSFITTFRFNEVIHYWALEGDWDCFENHYPSWKESPPAEIVTWMSVAPALRDGWEDSILQALPPSPLQ
jgi:hypothetical protein